MKIVTIKFYLNPRYKGVLYLSCGDKLPISVIISKIYKYPTKSYIIKAFKRWAIIKLDDRFKNYVDNSNSNFIHIYDLEIEEDELNKYLTH